MEEITDVWCGCSIRINVLVIKLGTVYFPHGRLPFHAALCALFVVVLAALLLGGVLIGFRFCKCVVRLVSEKVFWLVLNLGFYVLCLLLLAIAVSFIVINALSYADSEIYR